MTPPDFPSQAGSFKVVALLATGFLAVAAYFFWDMSRQELGKPEEQTKPPTPEEKILAVANKNPVPATELAQICDEFPDLAYKLLRDRKILVSGVIKRLWVKGVHSIDIAFDLAGSTKRQVTVYSDSSRYSRMSSGTGEYNFKYEKIGREVILMERVDEESNQSSRGKHIAKKAWVPSSVVYRENDTVQLQGLFERVDPGSLRIYRTDNLR